MSQTSKEGFVSLTDLVDFTPRQDEAFKSMFKHTFTLYGGARGGGKSYWLRWAMLSWILYQAKMGFPGIVGGLFSSTYTNLKDRQISKIASEFPAWLGVLKENKTLGLAFYLDKKFGGGALTLRNLDESTKYKSAEFGIIGVDELTEHTVDTFNILIGSLRWAGLKKPCFIAGSNPDGIGNDWVKNYFIHHVYPPELEPLSSEFNFVPALPTDNPHLDSSYYLMLNSLPDDLKRAWLLGDWDVFKGLAFKTFNKRTHVIDPIDIPDYWTRLVGIDSGYRAPFCALFGARNPDNGRVIIYKEIYETELTDRQQARKILDMSDDFEKKALRFADPAMWTRKTQEFITSSAQIYAQNGVPLRKGNNDRLDGKRKVDRLLNPMEDGLPGLLIFNTCPNLVKQLSQLVYDKYHTEDVDTRMEDHCLVADTLIKTSTGDKPISEVVVGDKVLTRQGYKKVLSSWMESPSTDVIKVLFSNGAHLIGTGNHPVWVEGKGWVRLDALRYYDIISTWKNEANQLHSTERFIEDSPIAPIGRTSVISRLLDMIRKKARTICIGIFGGSTTGKYQRDTKFTTKTRTRSTTIFQTLSAYLQKNTQTGTKYQRRNFSGYANMPKKSDHLLSNGISLKMDTNGTLNTEKRCSQIDQELPQHANNAETSTKYVMLLPGEGDSALPNAGQPIVGGLASITNVVHVPPAEKHLQSTDTQKASVAPVYVLGLCEEEEKQAVYNLEVEGANEFYANGVLVHNSYDALRYLLSSVRDYRAPQPSKYTKSPFLNLEHI